MLFAGMAKLFQTIGFGPVGVRLAIVQGISFAFIPIMISLVAGKGVGALPALFGSVVIGGLFHTFIATLHRQNPPCLAALGDGLGGYDDWARAGQGRHSICCWWRARNRQARV